MVKNLGILAISAIFSSGAYAQELVADPGFELLRSCPRGISMLHFSATWTSPTTGTPDLFNKCNGKRTQVSVPRNICGNQKPYEGKGYAGLILYEYQYYDYKEYLQTRLFKPLEKDAEYELSFVISLADNSAYAVTEIHALFTSHAVRSKKYTSLLLKPDIVLKTNSEYIDDKKNWVVMKGTYKATGGEEFLTLGNFTPDKYGKRKLIDKKADVLSAYYFIDAISFKQTKAAPQVDTYEEEAVMETKPVSDSLQEGRSFTLKNILFETDKDHLLPASINELERLRKILEEYPTLQIELIGHTDSQASDEHNADLSERRAKAVVNYLVKNGIAEERLTWSGRGETEPVTSNETEEGRATNRRVDFRIVKK